MKLSVVVLTANHEAFLARALDSVLDQRTKFEFEVVIADDCSTDGTRQVVKEYVARYPGRLRVVERAQRLGKARNFIDAYDACRSDYLALLEGDDYWISPTKLQEQIDFLDQHPDCTLCCHPVKYVNNRDEETGTVFPDDVPEISVLPDLLKRNFIAASSVVLRRGSPLKLPAWYYTSELADWPIYLLLAQNGNIGFLAELKAAYRHHHQRYWSSRPQDADVKGTVEMLRRMRRNWAPAQRRLAERQIASLHLRLSYLMYEAGYFRYSEKYRELYSRRMGWQADMPRREKIVRFLKRYRWLERCAWYTYSTIHVITKCVRLAWFMSREIICSSRALVRLLRNEGIPGLRRELRMKYDKFIHRRTVYQAWISEYDTISDRDRVLIRRRIAEMNSKPKFSIVMPVYNTPADVLQAAIDSVRRQLYPHWELCIADDASSLPHVRKVLEAACRQDARIRCVFRETNGHISAASNSALELVTGEFVALLDHDDEIAEHALYMMAEELDARPDADAIYSDEDKINLAGQRYDPFFKTDWNPDLMLSQNMISHLAVYRTRILKEIGGFEVGLEGSQDHDVALRFVERTSADRVRHIPHVLYHWRAIPGSVAHDAKAKPYAFEAAVKALRSHLERTQTRATVETEPALGCYRVSYELPEELPLVSFIIPTKDKVELLRQCIDGILDLTDYPRVEIIIADNGSQEPATAAYLKAMVADPRIQVFSHQGEFNFSAINNAGARRAKGSILCLLNNDIEVIDPKWLREMVSHALRPEVGVVGAKLIYPDDHIQHGGVVVGFNQVAGHAHAGRPRHIRSPFNRSHVTQNFSAVTGACMVLRREVLEEVGGFDEDVFPVRYNDVDLCLRIHRKGYRIVWTPYAELYHHESASLGRLKRPEDDPQWLRECQSFTQRWAERVHHDPYYNPNLSLFHTDYRLVEPPYAPRSKKPWKENGREVTDA